MLRNDSEVMSDGVWTPVLVCVLWPSVLLPANSLDFIVLRQLSHVSKLYICKIKWNIHHSKNTFLCLCIICHE